MLDIIATSLSGVDGVTNVNIKYTNYLDDQTIEQINNFLEERKQRLEIQLPVQVEVKLDFESICSLTDTELWEISNKLNGRLYKAIEPYQVNYPSMHVHKEFNIYGVHRLTQYTHRGVNELTEGYFKAVIFV